MMNATAKSASATPAESRVRRLLVRMNTTLFYCLGAAVLLESAAAAQAARAPAGDVDTTWLGEKEERARWLRNYVASVWPEFSWAGACAAIGAGQGMQDAQMQDAVARAVTGSHHMALFYRALSRIAEDPTLRSVLENIATVEQTRRDGMTSAAGRGPLTTLRRARFVRRYVEHTRNRVVYRAFDVLQQHWLDTPPFPAIGYDLFLARARVLLTPHLGLGWTQRLLYSGWLKSGVKHVKGPAPAASQSRDSKVATCLPGWARRAACALPHSTELR